MCVDSAHSNGAGQNWSCESLSKLNHKMDDCRGAQTIVNNLDNSLDYNQNAALPPQNGNYTLSGILDFLQSEWSRMEMERSEWEVERAELQVHQPFSYNPPS